MKKASESNKHVLCPIFSMQKAGIKYDKDF